MISLDNRNNYEVLMTMYRALLNIWGQVKNMTLEVFLDFFGLFFTIVNGRHFLSKMNDVVHNLSYPITLFFTH